jgi:tripartite-type tricarboxylate transporter receptor subunit TctC
LVDIMSGQMHMKFNSITAVVPLVRGGKMKALAVSTAQRSKVFPEVPTIIEAGVPGFETVTWYGLFFPAKTPQPIVAELNRHVVKILNDSDMVQRLADDGAEPRSSSPSGLLTYMREESERWKKAIKHAPPE